MLNASVVIASRNRANELRACLSALRGQVTQTAFEVIVVDNGSGDQTPAVIAAAACQGVRSLHVAEPNRARARNAGIAAARGELIVFCDDDTVAPSGFIEAHVRAHATARSAVVSGPIINVPSWRQRPVPGARHYSRSFLCTCNASVTKYALEAVGGFDETYDLYGWEDTDLGIRLKERGLRRIFAWDAYLYHIKDPRSMTLDRRCALAAEKGEMAARFLAKKPSLQVRLATGAYGANFARAAVFGAPPLCRFYERVARSAKPGSIAWTVASDALIDAVYVNAMRTALRRPRQSASVHSVGRP